MRNTDWMARCGWGVFCHYLTKTDTSADAWNRQVEAFDVAALARQLQAVHAPYFCITLGQGSGHYCAPNATYDRYAGVRPSKCSKRDLVSDLYEALHPLGIELLVYVPADGSWADHEARRGLGLTAHWCDDKRFDWKPGAQWARYRLPEFQARWEAVCRDWSLRFGRKIRAWWVDGAYAAEFRYPEQEPPNLRTYADALRAGNPDALVAFNPGVHTPVLAYTAHEDFTAGEIAAALPECPGPFVTGPGGHAERYHILSYLGASWCQGLPRFPDELVVGYTRHVREKGGAITWDVPISPAGAIPEPFLAQLRKIGNIRME
jgi:hypothetical protein